MNIRCPGDGINQACSGETKAKQIQTKRGPTTVYECISGCKNDKGYPLGTFAPRAPGGGGAQSAEVVEVLKKILSELQAIRQMANSKTTLAKDPLEQTPF